MPAKRDPKGRPDHNSRQEYTEEIKSDMVSEMVGIFGKGTSEHAQEAITDQIKAMKNVKTPFEILQPELKSYSSLALRKNSSHMLKTLSGGRRQACKFHDKII